MRRWTSTDAELLAMASARARDEGRAVFAPLLASPAAHGGVSGPMTRWAEMIEAIESEGWVLAEWTVSIDGDGRPQAFPLFRLDGSGRHRRRIDAIRLPD